MYAIETKKRKFDRILESINNASATTPVSQKFLVPGPNKTTSTVSASLTKDEPKKRARLSDESSLKSLSNPSPGSTSQRQPNYLPHSQQAFLARLSTFSSIQVWRISSSEDINAVEWAKRGWSCVGREMVACHGGCEAQMLVQLDSEPETMVGSGSGDDGEEDDLATVAQEKHKLYIQKYKELIITAHLANCPWRQRGCDKSIQRLPLVNAQASLRDLQTRYDGLLELPFDIPNNIQLGSDEPQPLPSTIERLHRDADVFRDGSDSEWAERNRNAVTLAMCGWEPGVTYADVDVVECRSCFRRLGLWLYRPKSPGQESTMEHLDAIDSHLDFCPWKSAEAQQTQIEQDGQKPYLPGWKLLCRTIDQESAKIVSKRNRESRQVPPPSRGAESVATVDSDLLSMNSNFTPEEKEKRTKALIRRLRELKKPFNVKALLKRKDQSKIDGKS